ncbi:MAG: RNA pseudouridine synthase [Gammaproteobacteria bacterium]|jgi:tRNA pseudouridine32 synthase / 23S rRNA pseudouridine746 synthase|nr:RNA pseudouridine synthase [Gammaproteobacteria bacterium]
MNDAPQPFELHVTVNSANESAVELLQQDCNLSKQAIKLAMNNGAVWLTRENRTQRIRRAKKRLQPGDTLHLYYNSVVQSEIPAESILIDDLGGYSVWCKPRGMRSQGSKWGDHCTIMRWAEKNLEPERISFSVHRLDMQTSGLILVAHSKSDAAALAKLFRDREIEKCYRAIVAGDLSMRLNPLRTEEPIDGKTAISEISFLELSSDGTKSLVDVRIETGRKHQIRKHLASIGHPVIGDRLYGTGETDGLDLQLTAYLIAFHCPIKDKHVEYRLPAEQLPGFLLS